MINTDKDWEKFAQADAYYSVLTQSRFSGIEFDSAARKLFFDSGEEHARHVLARLRRIDSSDPGDWDVMDFGCGVGRLLIPFATHCKQTFGVDVAPTMLQEALRNAKDFSCNNIEAGTLQDVPVGRRFDLIHSYIVFQHIPVEKGVSLIRELVSRLKPGGLIALHFTFSRTYPHSQAGWKLASRIPSLIPFLRLLRGQNPFKSKMLMGRYDLNEVLHVLYSLGLRDCEIEIVNDDGNLGAMIFGKVASGD